MKHATSPTNSISDQDETNDNLEETTEKETNQGKLILSIGINN